MDDSQKRSAGVGVGEGVLGGVSCFFSAPPSHSTRRLIQYLCKDVFICMLGMITFTSCYVGAAGSSTGELNNFFSCDSLSLKV